MNDEKETEKSATGIVKWMDSFVGISYEIDKSINDANKILIDNAIRCAFISGVEWLAKHRELMVREKDLVPAVEKYVKDSQVILY